MISHGSNAVQIIARLHGACPLTLSPAVIRSASRTARGASPSATEDQPGQDEVGRDFAAAWRAQPKWVVSRTLKSVGPNATLVNDDLEGLVRALKAEHGGEIEVAGPELAGSLTELGLRPRLIRGP